MLVAAHTAPPPVPLCDFQRDWIEDDSRFKFAVKSRRIGFTFGTTLEIALDVVNRVTKWLIISRTQATAKEAIGEVKTHLEAMRIAAAGDLEISETPTDLFFNDIRVLIFEIRLPNGSLIQALTAHPDAARGFGGNVFLDEFGFHADSYALWRGAFAAIARGGRLIVVSTPNYQQGKYYEIARQCGLTEGPGKGGRKRGRWSCHYVDIYTAAPQMQVIGVPIDIEELREVAGDEDTWQQEFVCQFLSSSEMWIPLELIAAARSAWATAEWDPARKVEHELYAGVDIGRKKDLTVIWIDDVQAGGMAITRGVIELERTPWAEQRRILFDVLAHPKLKRCCIDATGIGSMLAEEAKVKFGYKVEPVTFTREVKEGMAVLTRQRFEERLDKIPENEPSIERALAAVKRITTLAGNVRFDAERTDAGHADQFWAKALANMAADKRGCGMPEFRTTGVLRPSAQASGF